MNDYRLAADERSTVRTLLIRYLLAVVAVMVLILGLTLWFANRLAIDAALQEAEADARVLGSQLVTPLRARDLSSDESTAREQLAADLQALLDAGTVNRVKIWAPAGGSSGTIIFSDRASLEGQTFGLGDRAELFGTPEAASNVVDAGSYPGDPDVDLSHEVYVGFVDEGGDPFIFEAYLPAQTTMARSEILRHWLPLLLGAPALVLVASLPLTAALVRRLRRADQHRETLTRRALSESTDERRRMAQRLHDGVMQDLAGVGLALSSIDDAQLQKRDGDLLRYANDLVKTDLAELRALGTELSPRALERHGLEKAIRELSRRDDLADIELSIRVDPDLSEHETELLFVYQVLREGLRNMAKHSSAEHGWVDARRAGDVIVAEVRDDGIGVQDHPPSRGSLGLDLLRSAAAAEGGSLELSERAAGGTCLRVTIPARSAP